MGVFVLVRIKKDVVLEFYGRNRRNSVLVLCFRHL